MFFAGDGEKDPGEVSLGGAAGAEGILPIHPGFEGKKFFVQKPSLPRSPREDSAAPIPWHLCFPQHIREHGGNGCGGMRRLCLWCC